METIQQFLEKAGLSDIEIKIYVKLLEKGPKSVQELAQILQMNRTTMYNYINPLQEKGLVIRMVKGAHTLFCAEEIDESLTALVESKIESAKQIHNDLPQMLTKMHGMFSQDTDEGNFEIKYYKGKNGVRKIYEDALNSSELRSYATDYAIIHNYLPENEEFFTKGLERNENIQLYEMLSGSEESRRQADRFSSFSKKFNNRPHYKFLPGNVAFSSSDIMIYDGKVAIITIGEKISGIILKNKDYYELSKKLFDFIWKDLPEIQ